MRETLIFEPSVGFAPEPGSLEDDLLRACCFEDKELWDRLCAVPESDIRRAVTNLRRMGWNFSLVEIH